MAPKYAVPPDELPTQLLAQSRLEAAAIDEGSAASEVGDDGGGEQYQQAGRLSADPLEGTSSATPRTSSSGGSSQDATGASASGITL